MRIEILSPTAVPAPALAHWRALQVADERLESPFLSPDWAMAVERAQGGPDGGMRVVVLDDGAGLRGYLAARKGAFTAMAPGAPLCDYQGVVADPGLIFDPRDIVRALGVGRYDFSHMLADQSAFKPFARGSAASWVVDVRDGFAAHVTARRAAGETIIRDLERKRRKAERECAPLVFTALSRSQADFDQLFEWKRAQLHVTRQTDIFAPEWSRRLMRQLFEDGSPDFGGRLFTLHIGDALAAAQFHLCAGRTIHTWMIAHGADFERYSPGLLLFHDILRWMDGTPFDRLDLGAGDYRFKRELSNAQRQVAHGFVGVPSPAALFRGAAYGVCATAEALPLGAASTLPGRVLRRVDILRGLAVRA